jgi:formiminotetrahydrofolate cyclodeaminase
MSLHSMTVGEILESIAAKTPAPGGGAVAGLTGATAAALAQMVVSYSFTKKLAPHHDELRGIDKQLTDSRALCLQLAEEDAAAYERVSTLQKLPEDHPQRLAELDDAVQAATRFPLSAMAASVDLLRLLERMPTITSQYLRSDLAIAVILAHAATRAADWNVRVNLPSIEDRDLASRIRADADRLLTTAADLAERVERTCET